MRGRLDVRELDDPGDLALDAQQMMAGSSGNPLLMERTEVDVTVQKLSRRARGHDKAQAALRFRRTSAEQRTAQVERRLPDVEAAIARRVDTRGDLFRATVAGEVFDDRQEASAAIYEHIRVASRPGSGLLNGEGNRIEIGGFTVRVDVHYNVVEGRRLLLTPDDTGANESVQVDVDYDAVLDPGSYAERNVAQLLENKITGPDRVRERLVRNRAEAEATIETVDGQLGKPFKHADELAEGKTRLAEIDQKIRAMQEAEERGKRQEPTAEVHEDVAYSVTKADVIPTQAGMQTSEPAVSEHTTDGREVEGRRTVYDSSSERPARAQSARVGDAQRLGDEAKKITGQVEERVAAAVERVRIEAADKTKLSPALSVYRFELERLAKMCSTGLEAYSAAVESADSSAHEDDLKNHKARLDDAHGKIQKLQKNLGVVEAKIARSPDQPVSPGLYTPPAAQPSPVASGPVGIE